MSEHDHLGVALSEQLHAAVADLNPSPELLASVAAIPGAASRPRMRDRLTRRTAALAIPVPVAALAAAVVAILSGANPTPSLGTGVTVLPGGAVRMRDSLLRNAAGANAALRSHHVHNIVIVPMTATCPDRDWTYSASKVPPFTAMLFTPRTIPKGHVSVIAEALVSPGEIVQAGSLFRRTERLPTCASTHGWGVGMGDLRSWPAPKGQ